MDKYAKNTNNTKWKVKCLLFWTRHRIDASVQQHIAEKIWKKPFSFFWILHTQVNFHLLT